MTKTNSELALGTLGGGLSALLAERLEGARLLWIGGDTGLAPILDKAEHALQLDLSNERRAPLAAHHTRRAFRSGRLRFRPGSFDVIIIPDLWDVPGDLLRFIEDVVAIGEGGIVVFGVPYEGRAAYREFVELIDEAADGARLYGAVDFTGVSFAELGLSDARIVVASSPEPRYPQYILALAGDMERIPAAFIGELRDIAKNGAGAHEAGLRAERRRLEELEASLRLAEKARAEAEGLRAKAERGRDELASRLESERALAAESERRLEASLAEAKAQIEELTAAVAARSGAERELKKLRRALDEADAEIVDLREERAERQLLMSRFEARGEEIVELRAELERRRILLRDAVEEMRQLRRRGTGGSEEARRRVLEAEYALEKLRHERDELDAALLDARAKLSAGPVDDSSHGARDQQLEALEIALEDSEREKGKLHDEIAKLAEERAGLNERITGLTASLEMLEREVAERAHGEGGESAAMSSEQESRRELLELRGERDGLRLRMLNAEAALIAERARRGAESGAATSLKEREAELMEARAKVGTQELALETQSELLRKLQRDLAASEKELRDSDAREEQLRDETQRLRDALMAAMAERDELKARTETRDVKPIDEERIEALKREIRGLKEELTAQDDDLLAARRRAEDAEAATEEARRALEEAREALVALKRGGLN